MTAESHAGALYAVTAFSGEPRRVHHEDTMPVLLNKGQTINGITVPNGFVVFGLDKDTEGKLTQGGAASPVNLAVLGDTDAAAVKGMVLGGGIRTLSLVASTADTVLDQLPDGTYIGTSSDAAGGFGGRLWTATGSAASLTKTGRAATSTSTLLDTTGASIGGGTIGDAWALPNGDFIFYALDAATKGHLYLAHNNAGTWTVGANATLYNDAKAVLDIGRKSGAQPANIRSLHHRSLCVATIGGATVLLFGEYNVASGRVAGSTNDQVRVWKSTDFGLTWTILLDFNGNGSSSQVRHTHGIVQDPITGKIYFLFGDDPTSGLLRWDGVSAAPAANTPLASFRGVTGWEVLWDSTYPDTYRSGDIVFAGDKAGYLIDRASGTQVARFLQPRVMTRTGKMVVASCPAPDMSAYRDPLIGIALPQGGAIWISMWDTTVGATRGFDVWASADLVQWAKIGTIPDVGVAGTVGTITNLWWTSEQQLAVTMAAGSARLVAGSFGGTLLFDTSAVWDGVQRTLA